MRYLSDAPARRFIVELPDDLAQQLHELCTAAGVTRAAAIRDAIGSHVAQSFGRAHVARLDRATYAELRDYCSALGDANPDRVAALAIQSYVRRRLAADPELRLDIEMRRGAQRELPFGSPEPRHSGEEVQNAAPEGFETTDAAARTRRSPKRAETKTLRASSRKAG